ncbi:MAG: outer membrane beta-barrel family protein, partial [Alistipes sp.]|nr:outer membrane beta-barrel family protein [Alistipes sp.]
PVHRFEDGSWQLDPQSSIWFVDRTQSSGAYTRWSDMYGKFTYLVGLRLQWDRITYRNAEDTGYKHRNYWRLFPELSLSYTFNEEKGTNINLDFSRYSDRLPGNDDLSPRRVWQSQYSYTVGNENLEPGWGYDIDLSYTLRNKLTLNYGFTWSRGSARMTFFDPDDPNIVYTMEVNGLRAKSQYLAIDYATPITKWLRVDAFMNVYWTKKEVKGDKQASYSTEGGNGLLRLIFQPLSTMEVWVMATVDLPYKGLETRQNGSFSLSAGASKSLCNGKLLLTLNLHPIYYSKLKQTTKRLDESYYSVLRQPRGQRSFRAEFSLSYRFNRNAKKSVSTVQSMQSTGEILK